MMPSIMQFLVKDILNNKNLHQTFVRTTFLGSPVTTRTIRRVNIAEEENVVLFTGYNKVEIYQLGVDARNCAILDNACSSLVCGKTWIDSYINSLNENDRKEIKQSTGEKIFKFGGGTHLKSRAEYRLPAVISRKEITIKTDIVELDIQLLLLCSAMKRAGVKMDLENDSAAIFRKDIALNLTTSGIIASQLIELKI